MDIARKGNSKGRRLQEWVESQGMTMKDVMAFGDNHNDISMLSAAGLGVAMGNAADEVKAHADLIIPIIHSRVLHRQSAVIFSADQYRILNYKNAF